MGYPGITTDQAKQETRKRIEEAYERAKNNGLISPEEHEAWKLSYDYPLGSYQALWRGFWTKATVDWDPNVDDPNFYMDITTALLDALINQGGIAAWDGDGLGCASQIVYHAYKRRDYWRDRALKAEKELNSLKS